MNEEANNGIIFDTKNKSGYFLTNIGLVPLNNERGQPVKNVKHAENMAKTWGYPEVESSIDGELFILKRGKALKA